MTDDDRDDRDLDRLLAMSSPTVVAVDDALIRDVDRVTMAAQRLIAGEQRRPRRSRPLFVGLALALAICSGAGAAVASGGFAWLPWAQNPDVSQSFALPSGRQCEERIILKRTWYAGDWDRFVADAGRIRVDESAVDETLQEIRKPGAAIQMLTPAGRLSDPPPGAEPTEDDWYLTARHVAVGHELNHLSRVAGLGDDWSSDFQVQCAVAAP